MAVDVCSEVSSLAVSPRISFSHDLREADSVPVECHGIRSDALLLESIDFNFCIGQSFSQELLSSADELFANGKILPAEVKKITNYKPKTETPSRENLRSKPISPCFRKDSAFQSPRTENAEAALNYGTKKKSLKEFLSVNLESDAEAEEEGEEKRPSITKPFWQFGRSSSLNIDSCKSKTLIRSLYFLSRSNSTGSAPNPKSTSVLPKVIPKQHSKKDQSSSSKRSNTSMKSSSGHHSQPYGSLLRSPSRKNYGNGVRISPVLNIPHACISKGTVSLFGFGSLFCSSKSKKKKKCNS